jgi:hypothetical protein
MVKASPTIPGFVQHENASRRSETCVTGLVNRFCETLNSEEVGANNAEPEQQNRTAAYRALAGARGHATTPRAILAKLMALRLNTLDIGHKLSGSADMDLLLSIFDDLDRAGVTLYSAGPARNEMRIPSARATAKRRFFLDEVRPLLGDAGVRWGAEFKQRNSIRSFRTATFEQLRRALTELQAFVGPRDNPAEPLH